MNNFLEFGGFLILSYIKLGNQNNNRELNLNLIFRDKFCKNLNNLKFILNGLKKFKFYLKFVEFSLLSFIKTLIMN